MKKYSNVYLQPQIIEFVSGPQLGQETEVLKFTFEKAWLGGISSQISQTWVLRYILKKHTDF